MALLPEERTLCGLLTGCELPTLPGSSEQWEGLFTTARQQGIAPMLAWRLQALAETSHPIPEAIRDRLPRILRQAAANSLQVDRTLAGLDAGLQAAGIQALFLKGAYFRSLYPNPTLRMLDDIDLLAARQDLEATGQVIAGLGYQRMRPLRHNDDLWLATDHHYIFHGLEKQRLVIELHWNLGGNDGEWRTPPLDWFWEQTAPLPTSGLAALTLSPTAQLLHQAAHQFLQHPDRLRLKWLYDLHLLVTCCAEAIDWEMAVRKAADFHWSHALGLALVGIQERFGTPLPTGVVEKLEQDADPRSIALFELANKQDSTATERALGFLNRLPPSARRQHLLGLLFPSRKYLLWRYKPRPAWTFFLYYPYRWFFMALDFSKTLLSQHQQG